MDYTFRYKLQTAPEYRNDGSGMVMHDIYSEVSRDDGETWEAIPGRHKSIVCPASEVSVAVGNVAQYKQMLVNNIKTSPVPILGWNTTDLRELMIANDAAKSAAEAANTWITVTLGLSYPVTFTI